MSGLYLFARIAGTPVAICTDEVEAVVRLKELSPAPGAPPYVAGLFAVRSRVLTIINAAALVAGSDNDCRLGCEEGHFAIVCEISGHSYGIMVDGVDDIQTIDTAPLPICGRVSDAWQPYAKTVIEHDGSPHFILSMTDFLESCLYAQAA